MIRKGVGAVVQYQGKFLLAQRMKALQADGSLQPIPPEWDFVKGGIDNEPPEAAILRELLEETGSSEYLIRHKYRTPLRYPLPKSSGYAEQETIMFLVEYHGKPRQLHSDAAEIGRLAFCSREEVLAKLTYTETREWFARNAGLKH